MSQSKLDRGTKIYIGVLAAIAAQKKLAGIQGRVRKLVEAEPDIERVSWRVDTDWFAAHGVKLQLR